MVVWWLLPIVLIVGVIVGMAGISICRASGQVSRAEEWGDD